MLMDQPKKRKAEEDGAAALNEEDLKLLLESLPKEQLVDLLQDAALRHYDILKELRKAAEEDPTPRKIFVRGLGWDTKADAVKKVFSQYGEVEDVVVVTDKNTHKGRGYGFVTFTHAEEALRALKDPDKMIEGRNTTCNPMSQGAEHVKANPNITHRKIYVSNVPEDATFDKLHKFFSQYGEIAEGPIGFEKSGKCKGYTLIVYKTLDGARKALQQRLKMFEGNQLRCKLAEGAPLTDIAEAKQAIAAAVASASLAGASSGAGVPGGYALPYVGYDPSGLPAALALNSGLQYLLSNPLAQTLNPNPTALGLGASTNSPLGIDPSLAALYPSLSSLYSLPSLSSLSSDSVQALLSGAGQSLSSARSSLGLASLGAHSGSLSGYPAQLAAYSGLATSSLYDAGTSSYSQVAANPVPLASSYTAAHLEGIPADRARIAEALGKLTAYYDR